MANVKSVKILIKGGSGDDFDLADLSPRELLVNTDNYKELYIGDGVGEPIRLNPDIAAEAEKLATPITIGLNGDVTGSTSTDLSANVAITATLANSGVTPGTYDAVTVNAKGLVTAGSSPTYTADKAVGTNSSGVITTINEVSTNELRQLAGVDTTQTVQDQFDGIVNKLDDYIEIDNLKKAVSGVVLNQSATNASLTVTNVNTEDGTSTPSTTNIQIASTTQIGLMPSEAYVQLQQATEDIEMLRGASKRYVVNFGSNINPTQTELQEAYETASGLTGEALDGTTLFDIDNGLEYQWFETQEEWVRKGSAVIGLATNDAAGIVKGASTAGKIFVESDGTMALNGYDGLVPNTRTIAGQPLSSNIVLPTLTIKDDEDTIGTYNASAAVSIDIAPVIEGYMEDYGTAVAQALSGKIDKVTAATADNFAVFVSGGNVADSNIAKTNVVLTGDILDGGTFGS